MFFILCAVAGYYVLWQRIICSELGSFIERSKLKFKVPPCAPAQTGPPRLGLPRLLGIDLRVVVDVAVLRSSRLLRSTLLMCFIQNIMSSRNT